MSRTNRRQILKSLIGGATTTMCGGLSQLAMIRDAVAAPSFNDYKALVVVFLHGGNDSANMLVPIADSGPYDHGSYAGMRGQLAVAKNALDLNDFMTNGQLGSNPYFAGGGTSDAAAYAKGFFPLTSKGVDAGINSVMPELASQIDNDNVALIANVGNLIEPINKAQYLDQTRRVPPFLFAHNHQRRAMFTGWGDNLAAAGWSGRIADEWLAGGVNNNSQLGMNISYVDNTRLLNGDSTVPLVLPAIGNLIHADVNFLGDRRTLFETLNARRTGDYFFDYYNRVQARSQSNLIFIRDLLAAAPDSFAGITDSYGGELFSAPSNNTVQMNAGYSTELIPSLHRVAQMIDLAGSTGALGVNRQVFFVQLSGFDNHAGQRTKHPALLRGLSLGLDKFQRAMEALGVADKVTLYTMSDFGRSLRSNGNGTDHGWGAAHFVMGGAVKGGLIGQLPDISLGSDDDVSGKGRILPSIAQDQLNATIASWFGVDDEMMRRIFPNLQNFQTDSTIRSAYLDLFD